MHWLQESKISKDSPSSPHRSLQLHEEQLISFTAVAYDLLKPPFKLTRQLYSCCVPAYINKLRNEKDEYQARRIAMNLLDYGANANSATDTEQACSKQQNNTRSTQEKLANKKKIKNWCYPRSTSLQTPAALQTSPHQKQKEESSQKGIATTRNQAPYPTEVGLMQWFNWLMMYWAPILSRKSQTNCPESLAKSSSLKLELHHHEEQHTCNSLVSFSLSCDQWVQNQHYGLQATCSSSTRLIDDPISLTQAGIQSWHRVHWLLIAPLNLRRDPFLCGHDPYSELKSKCIRGVGP